MRWLNIEQGSDEWFRERLGRATASNFHKIMANEGKAFGNPAEEYAEQIAIESLTGRQTEDYTNEWMVRGNELEPVARYLYEQKTGNVVWPGGMFLSDCGRFSASPDGRLDDNSTIEIKSVKWNTQFETIKKGVPSKHKWQIQGNIWLGDLDFVDFVSYCPEMYEPKQLIIYRVDRDDDLIRRLQERLEQFWELVINNQKLLQDGN